MGTGRSPLASTRHGTSTTAPAGRLSISPLSTTFPWISRGDPVTIEGTELLARCIQHETDHLDGILFIDRMDEAQRKAAMKAIRDAEWWSDPVPRVRVSPHKTHGQAF